MLVCALQQCKVHVGIRTAASSHEVWLDVDNSCCAQGSLPAGLGSLSNAVALDISSNNFNGCLPASLQARTPANLRYCPG